MSTPSQKHLVTRSGINYYRLTVPYDLKHHYKKRELKISLKTPNRSAALLLYASVESKMQMEFAMLRSGLSVSSLSQSTTATPVALPEVPVSASLSLQDLVNQFKEESVM